MTERVIKSADSLKKRTFFSTVKAEWKKNWILYLMLVPAIIFVFIFSYLPMGGTIIAFKDYKYNVGIWDSPWIGFKNFSYFINSGKMWSLTKNTIAYNVVFLFSGVVVRMVMAIMIQEMYTKIYKRTLQSIMMLPHFLSWVVIGGLAYNMLNYEFGTINNVLEALGFERWDVYNEPGAWKYIFTAVSLWQGVGYGMIFYLAALTGINPEIYEAAYIDGASIMKRIIHITIPMIIPTTTILILLSLGSILKGNMDMFYQLVGNNSNLYKQTDVIDTYVFRTLTVIKDYSVTTAAGLYQQVVGCVLVLTVNAIVKRIDNDSAIF